jgi:hypothetical protein
MNNVALGQGPLRADRSSSAQQHKNADGALQDFCPLHLVLFCFNAPPMVVGVIFTARAAISAVNYPINKYINK